MRILEIFREALIKTYYYIGGKFSRKPYDTASIWIREILKDKEAQLVQIGSNDGKTSDPLYNLIIANSNWRVLFVEPVTYLFQKLRGNYGSDARFSFANVAINEGIDQAFYSVKEEAKQHIAQLPIWYDQLGSFDREHIVRQLDGILEPYIEKIVLPGMSLKTLFQKYELQKIDLLHVDAEGYDWKILAQLNFDQFYPKIILFEHVHLSWADKHQAIRQLRSRYSIFCLGDDLICLNRQLVNLELLSSLNGRLVSNIFWS